SGFPFVAYQPSLFGPKGGVVIFSRLPIENHTFYHFSALGSFKNLSFYTRLLRNGMLVCKIKDTPLTILNTHLVTDFEFEESSTNHLYSYVKNQVEEVIQKVNELSSETKTL